MWIPRSRPAIALVVLAGVSAVWRLWMAATKSFSHPEMWAPLIPIPSTLASPGMMETLYETFVFSLMSDTHPPGFNVMEWFWMKVAGSSAVAIRMPSVVMGVATVVLLWLLARECGYRKAALPAAALLAFHGYHAAWSGFARMYAPACFFAVLSVWLLVRLLRRGGKTWLYGVYAVSVLAGLSLHVYFWAIAGAQILYVAARGQARGRLFTAQAAALTLGSPLLALAAYQSFNGVATLRGAEVSLLGELFAFAMVAPLQWFTDVFDAPSLHTLADLKVVEVVTPARWLWWAGCASLAAWGAWRMVRDWEEEAAGAEEPPMPVWVALVCAAVAVGLMQVFISRIARPHEVGIALVRWLRLAPLVMAGLALAAARVRLPWLSRERLPARLAPLVVLVVSLAMLMGAAAVRPILTPRGLLSLAPFVLLLLARGGEALLSRSRAALPLVAVVAVAYGMGIHGFSTRLMDPIDFVAFTRQLEPRMEKSDLVFMRRLWDTTPVLFHLSPKEHPIYVDRFCQAMAEAPAARVWELRFYEQPNPPELGRCVAGLPVVSRVRVGLAEAVLYQRTAAARP